MTVPQSTLERVRKLLALSASTNEAESAAAMSMARKILSEYELTVDDIAVVEDSRPDMKRGTVKNANYEHWERLLAQTIAENFGCFVYLTHYAGSKKANIHYAGRASDVDMCVFAHSNLREQMRRMGNEAWKKAQGRTGYSRGKWVADYKAGLVARLSEKLENARTTEDTSITALVLAKDAAAKLWAHEQAKIGKARNRSIDYDPDAVRAGYRDGKDLNIQGGLPGKARPQLGGA